MKRFARVFWRILEKVGSGILVVLVVILFAQVVARYFFNFSIFWSEEIARFIFIYLVLLGACTVAHAREHIRITYFISPFSQNTQRMITFLIDILVIFFLVILFVTSLVMVKRSFHTLSQALDLPWAYVYLACTISAFVMLADRLSSVVKEILAYFRR